MLAATLVVAGVALTQTTTDDADPYIVVLEDGADSPSQIASGIEQRQEDLEVDFVYSNALEGFSATIPDERLAAVRANPHVDYVEPDKMVSAVDQTLPWGIDRIQADKSSTKAGEGRGAISNVNVYVIDTGIDQTHPDLNDPDLGIDHVNFTGDGKNYDCNGHGTLVAGIMAARDDANDVVGVASGAPLTDVKVIGCDGTGSASTVIEGIDWVTANAVKPAIANLSLVTKTSRDRALDTAVKNSADSGVFYSVAAGNNGRRACKHSPAAAGKGTNNGIVTTAATRRSNAEPSWSNYGRCVDLWAPGAKILSTKNGGGTRTSSGTSMAAPHVGGTGALYLSGNTEASPTTVEKILKSDSMVTRKKSKDGRRIRLVYAGGY
jgi:subtilisin family serine protease